MLREKFIEKREYYLPDWKQRGKNAYSAFRKWKRTIIQQFFSLLIHLLFVVLIYAFLLSGVNYFWFVIGETQVGLQFSTSNSSSFFLHVLSILRENTLYLAWRLSSDVVINSFLVGLALQVLPIRRYFFDPYGILNRIIYFFIFAGITALNISGNNYPLSFELGFVLYFFPVCCLLELCLNFSGRWLPEITLIFKIPKEIHNIIRVAEIRGGLDLDENQDRIA